MSLRVDKVVAVLFILFGIAVLNWVLIPGFVTWLYFSEKMPLWYYIWSAACLPIGMWPLYIGTASLGTDIRVKIHKGG